MVAYQLIAVNYPSLSLFLGVVPHYCLRIGVRWPKATFMMDVNHTVLSNEICSLRSIIFNQLPQSVRRSHSPGPSCTCLSET